jgi:cytochrome c-type biogenesis protein CcmH/NrfG
MMIPPIGFMGPLAIPPAMANGPVRGPLAPPPPPGWLDEPAPGKAAKPVGRQDPARASQLVVMGDRLFRAGKFKNAEDRYSQAARLDAASAGPRIRLAQVALVREQYAEAAHWYREAETAQPGWIVTAPDVQGIFPEPTDFARYLARLESYLQAHPEDRDAWLVLGAEWYLTGRTARAADVFLRLNDPTRKTDIALAAFLDATNQH